MTGALAIWGLLGLVLPAGVAALLVFGLYAGYNYFSLVHHWHNTIAAKTSRASPTCDDSSDSITSITIDRS
jgi:hypothetical protein